MAHNFDPSECPRFKWISENYISSAPNPEEKLKRTEEIQTNKVDFFRKGLERGSLKWPCICDICVSAIWNLSEGIRQ